MDWSLIFNWVFITGLLASGIRLALPIAMAEMGEIFSQKSGIMNLGLEGVMTVGAVTCFSISYLLENYTSLGTYSEISGYIGLIGSLILGMLMGLLIGYLSITLKVDQIVSGVTLAIFGVSLSEYYYFQVFKTPTLRINGFSSVEIPLLSKIPVLGEILFSQSAALYIVIAATIFISVCLNRTVFGRNVRAVGECPIAADTSGISVSRVRYIAIIISNGLVGLAGGLLIMQTKMFGKGIMGGKGWIAIVMVAFSRWKPSLGIIGALIFGCAEALQYRLQAVNQTQSGVSISYEFLLMLPYLITLIAMIISKNNKIDAPSALTQPYPKDEC